MIIKNERSKVIEIYKKNSFMGQTWGACSHFCPLFFFFFWGKESNGLGLGVVRMGWDINIQVPCTVVMEAFFVFICN